MKICCIFNILPAYRRAIFELMSQELDVTFFAGENQIENIALLKGSELRGFKKYLRNIYSNGKLVWQKGALKEALFRRYDCYILTGNAGIRSNWLIAVAARLMGRRVYLWSHGLHGNESRMTLFKNMLYARLAGNVLVYGERGRELMVAQGFDESRITVIYNSLDYDQQLKIRNKISDRGFIRNYFGQDQPVICFVGRLTRSKKLDLLLNAISDLECNLILLGDGPARESLEAMTATLGIQDRVWFYGESYDQQIIGAILYHSSVCVSPGNVGLTAIHAMTFGTPVITHNNLNNQGPEVESVIENLTGSYFQENNSNELRQAIIHYIDLDTTNREQIRQNCYRVIDQKFNPKNQIKILKRVMS